MNAGAPEGVGIAFGDMADITALDLAKASLSSVAARKREQWLDLFDDDSVVEDPVGPSPLDPPGKGHKGREAIARFYDRGVPELKSFEYEIRHSCLCGEEAAVLVTFRTTSKDGEERVMDAMNVYVKSPTGKLAALRSFWDGSHKDSY